jgi:hypothetical protein
MADDYSESTTGDYVLIYKSEYGYYVCGEGKPLVRDLSGAVFFEENEAKMLAEMMPDVIHATRDEAIVIMIMQS